jgi:hypothetical protein
MPDIPAQAPHVNQIRNAALALAHVLAYVEGAGDERAAMLARQEIMERYAVSVENEGWQPPFAAGDA